MKAKKLYFNSIRVLIKIVLILLFFLCLNGTYKSYFDEANYYSGLPQYTAFFWMVLYVPFLVGGIWGLIFTKRKLRLLCQDDDVKDSTIIRMRILKMVFAVGVRIVIGVVVILIVSPFIGLYIATEHHVFYKNNSLLQNVFTAEEYQIDDNVLSLRSEDGIDLWVSEVSVENPSCIIICLSGIAQPSVTQFYPQAKYLQQKGFASFLLEVRGHGRSCGDKVCLGYDETKDVAAVLKYIKENEKYRDVPIVIQGVSMGGAIATNSFGTFEEIDGLIAMSAYSSVEDEIEDFMKHNRVPGFICSIEKVIVKQALKISFGKMKVEQNTPYNQIKNSNGRPVLLIGSSGDTSVIIGNLYRLNEACPEAEVWVKDSWEHFIVNDCDFRNVEKDTEYCKRITGFIENVIGEYHNK